MNRSLRKYLCLLLLLAGAISSSANPAKDINLRFVDARQGLSHQTVNCFCQDEFGFLWIGTQDGLNCFDGRRVEVFKPDASDPNSLPVSNIRQLYSDGNGHIYIRGLRCVAVYDMRRDCFETLYDERVGAIAYADSTLWVASGGEILFRRDGAKNFVRWCTLPAGNRSVNYLLWCREALYAATASSVFRFDRQGRIVKRYDAEGANTLMEDSHGNLWIATRDHGLMCYAPDGELKRYEAPESGNNGLSHNNVRQILQAGESLYYVASFGGLQTLDTRTGEFVDYSYDVNLDAFNVRSILSLFRDRSGTLWMGTFYLGAQYYNVANDVFHYFRSSKGEGRLPSPIVSAIAEESPDCVWFGTEGGGLNYYDRHTRLFYPFTHRYGHAFPAQVVKALCYDRKENQLWVASLFDGVYAVDLRSGAVRHVSPEVKNASGHTVRRIYNIVRMVLTPDGKSLLLAAKGGLVQLDKARMELYEFQPTWWKGDRTGQAWDLLFDRKGDLWVANSLDVQRLELQHNRMRSYTYADIAGKGRAQYPIIHLACDDKGRIWLGSAGDGIFCYLPASDRFVNYGQQQGLANGFITGMQSGRDGMLYVATNGGLSKFSTSSASFENYNDFNDFPLSSICDGGLCVTSDDRIFACGLNGVVTMPSSDLNNMTADYRVFVKAVYVDNKRVRASSGRDEDVLYSRHLTIGPRNSVVTFYIATNNIENIAHERIEYRLEGFDNGFIEAGDNRTVTYTNLNSGHYCFVVRGVGTRERSEFEVRLKVIAPFYKQAWFVLTILLLLGLLAGYLIRAYWIRRGLRQSLAAEQREKEHIERVNQSKLRFFTNVSHEFRTPLTLISGELEMLLMQRDVKPAVYNKIVEVYKNSKRMNRLVDEIIDLRRQDQGYLKLRVAQIDVVKFVQEIFHSFRDYATYNRIAYTCELPDEPIEIWADERQLEKVFNNLLSNAFKYTPAEGVIVVSLRRDSEEEIEIAVSNTGKGILPENLSHVFERFWEDEDANSLAGAKGSGIGLSLSKGIVEMHGGHIEVESTPNELTRFSVILPTSKPEVSEQLSVVSGVAPAESEVVEPLDDKTFEKMTRDAADKSVKMLVVEDNPRVSELLVRLFSNLYEVYTAANGAEGLEKARVLQPTIILSDIMMPVMSGLEMCRRLKTEINTSHIPIVLLTARNTEEHTVEGLQTGADDYVTKPFRIQILVARINNLVRNRRQLQQRYLHDRESDGEMLTVNPLDRKILQEATAIVERHLADTEFDVPVFARELGMSRTLLFMKLKGLTGRTPNEFIVNMRLKRALSRFDSSPELSIADVAYEVGFSTPSYFIKCFKATYGITPNAYRHQKAE